MSTGNFENWAGNISDIGPIYPFVGSEVFLWILGLVLWIAWHVIETKRENRTYEEEVRKYGDPENLRRLISEEDPKNP
ncbi:MAG: hypothetical protein OEM98_07445 [Gammaproteobacteria bacterium]|nr:hypothetical protein [Gammaproteobacteria bacterium]